MKNINIDKKIISILFYLIPFIIIGTQWIFVFPANLSTDSIEQLYQIQTNQYSDVHPAAQTLFCKLLMQIYNSPAIVIFFQILSLSLVTGYIFKYIWSKGVSGKILFPLLIVWSSLEPIRNVTCYFWKDVFFAIALLLLTVSLIKILDLKKETKTADLIFSTISLIVIALFRHNGILIYIIGIIIYIYLTVRYGKKFLLPIIVSLSIIILTKTLIYSMFSVEPNNNGTKYALPAKAIISVVYNDGNYTEEELAKIEELMPKEYIKKFYDREIGQGLLWRTVALKDIPSFAQTLVGKEELIKELFLELFPKNARIMINDMLGSASLMLKIQVGDKTKNMNPELINSGLTRNWEYGTIFDHNMLYFLIIIICMLILIKFKKIENAIVFIPAIVNVLSIVISNISYESRYAYPTIVVTAVLLAYTIYQTKNPTSI